MYRKLICSIFAGCFCAAIYAQDLSTPPSAKSAEPAKNNDAATVVLNLGSHTEFFNNIQNDTSGGMRQFDFAPTIGAGLAIPLKNQYTFLPEANWVLPRTTSDSKVLKNIFMLRADLGHNPVDWFRVRVGTSLIWLNQHGKGGSVQMNNGNTTSTFYYPDENRSSLNNTLDLGAEALFLKNWAFRLQTYIYSVFREERRQVSYTLFLSYYWDR